MLVRGRVLRCDDKMSLMLLVQVIVVAFLVLRPSESKQTEHTIASDADETVLTMVLLSIGQRDRKRTIDAKTRSHF